MNVVDNFDLDSENLKRREESEYERNFEILIFDFKETRSNYLINNQIEIDSIMYDRNYCIFIELSIVIFPKCV